MCVIHRSILVPIIRLTSRGGSSAPDVEHERQVALLCWADSDDTLARYSEVAALYAVPNCSIRLNGTLAHIAKRQNERLL